MTRFKDLLLFITFAIPKAGAKIAGFPLYISLISSFYFMLLGIVEILKKKFDIFYLLLPMIFMLIIVFFNQFSFTVFHYSGGPYLNITSIIAYVISMFAFLCYYGALGIKNTDAWKKKLSHVFYLLISYALLQKIFGDYTVVIPGITANFQDAMTANFLADKSNMIWGIGYLKATSTYQNGNLFGANLLLIGFAVIANLKADSKKIIMPLSLLSIVVLLTASASIYFGLIVALAWMFFTSKTKSTGSLLILLFGLVLLIMAIAVVFSTDNIFSKIIYERIINRDLTQGSGRIEKIISYLDIISENPWVLVNGMLFFNKTFYEIYEVLPAAILQVFGLPMLFSFTFFLCVKVRKLFGTPYILPFVAYFSASLSDGAFWLPPTATNLFIILGMCTIWSGKRI